MRLLSRPADRFERALGGSAVTDEQLAELVETSRHLVDLGARMGPAPDPAFVTALRERLMAEAATLPTPSPAAARAAASRRAAAKGGPVVVVVGRGLPRALAGATASALLVGAVVGVASRTAVPGEALYPVKGWLDGVAVRLADSDLDRGRTFLAQAQEHISDARELTERTGRADAGTVDVALQGAIDSVRGGQRALDLSYARTGNPQALLAMGDFTARALPQIEVLRTEVPAGSLPRLAELESLLHDTQQATARRVAACGPRCEGMAGPASGPAGLPSSITTTSASPGSASAGQPGSGSESAGGGITVPQTGLTNSVDGSSSTPGVSIGSGGATIGSSNGGATVSTGGATVNGPTISASVPVVSTTVQVPLPSATLGTSGGSVTVPSTTIGSLTLPGVTITLP